MGQVEQQLKLHIENVQFQLDEQEKANEELKDKNKVQISNNYVRV